MPLKTKSNTFSFSETYYRDKFNEKKAELSNLLKLNPNDLTAKKQVQFIDKLLEAKTNELGLGKDIDWPTTWKNWERLVV